MPSNAKRAVTGVASVAVIVAAGTWIYFKEYKAPEHNVALHQTVGEIMAGETARVIGNKGKIVLVTIPTDGEPELKTQLDAFKQTLKKSGAIEIKEYELETKDQPKYGVGAGLSGRRFVRIVNKNQNADAIVSFVGAPKLSAEDLAQLGKVPKFIAEARSPNHLSKLFEKKLLAVAVVYRFRFPAPVQGNPRTAREWFDKRFQVVAAENAESLPTGTEEGTLGGAKGCRSISVTLTVRLSSILKTVDFGDQRDRVAP